MDPKTFQDRREFKRIIKENASFGGWTHRHSLLAYAMLRGRPYRGVELLVREHNEPSPTTIATMLDCEVATVKAWLATPATEAMLAKRAAGLAAFHAAKVKRAEEWRAKRSTDARAAE